MTMPFTVTEKRRLLPIADHKSRVLILDMLPGEKSKILQQYYPVKSNNFWKIMCRVLREPNQPDYKMKKQMLLRHGVALWNVLEEVEPSLELPNDFKTFFLAHPTINRIIFNGNNAAECYNTHIGVLPGITQTVLPSTSSLNTWKSLEEKIEAWKLEFKK